jgi:DNA adenine methylase
MPQPAVTSTSTKPFLKWAGGKRQLLPDIARHIPAERLRHTYHEPFLGGGAVFFHLRPQRAILSDSNHRLIRAYRGLRDDCDRVIRLLRSYPHDKDFFLEMRKRDIDCASDAHVAAWLIYLNRTGYNGLYRVNSKNRFNVPFGRYTNPTICDAAHLRTCAAALRNAQLELEDFGAVEGRAKRGDLVYFDPPYVPLSATSSFTAYTSERFDAGCQERLRDVALALKQRGIHVLISNSDSPEVRKLYRGFELETVRASRNVNSKAEGRGKISELLIW